jgi:Mrp family chromosome partitioning ATPase
LFSELKKQFDYIVIDCPAIGLVTDALLLSKYTDTVLYMVRQRYTYKKQVSIIQSLANDKRFKRIDIVFNDIKTLPGYNYAYGFNKKYSYRYYEEGSSNGSSITLFGKRRRRTSEA